MTDIHENLPPTQLPFFTLFDWIIITIFLMGIVFTFWKIMQKPQKITKKETIKNSKIQKFIPKKFSLIKEIEKLKILQQEEKWKIFSLESTSVLKKILEQKLEKPFAFATGKELSEILQEKLSASELYKITEFFTLLDPIKFAKVSGKKEVSEKILQILHQYK